MTSIKSYLPDRFIAEIDFDKILAQGHEIFEARGKYVVNYSFAIPNQLVLDKIASYGKVVEMGAGTGYWASLLQELGSEIRAFDTFESHFKADAFGKHFKVSRGGPEILTSYERYALFLCWPPMTDMAERCLDYWRGKHLIYIGEPSGCTATPKFEKLLEQ